jgi:hypothetical protein
MRLLEVNQRTGDFELNGQPIGNYMEAQAINRAGIRILHSLEHNPSYGEIVAWPNSYGPHRVHRLSTVIDEATSAFVVVRDRWQWEPRHEHRSSDD